MERSELVSIVVVIDRDEDCQNIDRDTAGHLVKFSSQVAYGQDSCSLNLHNQWFAELQNGFGVFLPKRMDCGSIVTVECLPDSVLSNRVRHLSLSVSLIEVQIHVEST